MSENPDDTIQRLLREGLDHYGVDEISAAIVTWQKVLELDPGNVEAIDYLRNADRRERPRGGAPAAPPRAGGAVVGEAKLLLRQGEFAAAFELLAGATGPDASGIEYQAVLDLARSRLYGAHCARVHDLDRVPRLRAGAGPLTQHDLPAGAGFVLTLIDGETSLEDVISLSGMDALEALHAMCGLLDAGLLELTGA